MVVKLLSPRQEEETETPRRHRVKGKSGQTGGTVSTAASNSFFVSLKSEKPFHIIFAFIPIIVTKLG